MILCGVLLAIIIILEIRQMVNSGSKSTLVKVAIANSSNSKEERPLMNYNDLNKLKETKKFVLLNNLVIDVTKFVDNHPGGKNLLKDHLYEDVGRFITGTESYGSKFSPYDHSASTQKHMIEKMCIGEFKDASVGKLVALNGSPVNDGFVIMNKIIIAENTTNFQFHNSKYNFSRFLTGADWLGKHYSVTSTKLNKTRYYSSCLTLDPVIKEKHLLLLDNLKKQDKGILNDCIIKPEEVNCNYLNLYIKKYNFKKGLSGLIHSIPEKTENDLIITGPIGLGLGITGKLKGSHVVIAGGTGVFPFLDLVSLTLRYAAFKINKNLTIYPEENFDYITDDYQLIFMTSFSSDKLVVFNDICEDLMNLDQKHNLNLFKYVLRVSNNNSKQWDENFFKGHLSNSLNKLEKVYIVGPVGFMDNIKNNISGICNKDKILMV